MKEKWARDRLTIGEVSRLHNIPAKTLRHWDKIGLFKPLEIDQDTGYRYYSTSQFYELNLISYLRLLDVPLKELVSLKQDNNMFSLLKLLQNRQDETDRRINELKMVKKKLEEYSQEIEDACRVTEFDTVKIEYYPARRIIYLPTRITSRIELQQSIRNLEQHIYGNSRIPLGKFTLTIAKEDFVQKKYELYSGIYLDGDEYQANPDLARYLPAGEYAAIYYWGTLQDTPPYYEKILDYANENGYEICGDVSRRPVTLVPKKAKGEYLAKIEAPIRKLQKFYLTFPQW